MAKTDIETTSPQPGTVREVRDLMEQFHRTDIQKISEPGSDVDALVKVSPITGVQALPASIFDDYRARPRRRGGIARFTELDSLIAHVERFKDVGSVLFASDDRLRPSITAVLDYHPAGSESDPRFGEHRGEFRFPLSDEWNAWSTADKVPMGMADFAAFLEDRIVDVLHLIPGEDSLSEELQKFVDLTGGTVATPQRLMELSVGLKVNERGVLKEAINLASGESQVQFVSEHVDDAGQPLKVPGLFLIGIPVFRHGPIYRIAARLRYRKTPGGLVFFYERLRADRTFDHAFNEACERARVETDLPLFFGSPE